MFTDRRLGLFPLTKALLFFLISKFTVYLVSYDPNHTPLSSEEESRNRKKDAQDSNRDTIYILSLLIWNVSMHYFFHIYKPKFNDMHSQAAFTDEITIDLIKTESPL